MDWPSAEGDGGGGGGVVGALDWGWRGGVLFSCNFDFRGFVNLDQIRSNVHIEMNSQPVYLSTH
jgi:hypothetical protein